MYEVIEVINSKEPKNSFSLHYHDWSLLERSRLWNRLNRYFEACQDMDSKKSQKEKAEILH